MAWVWVLLGICALIVLHEGGHFAAAKAVGMRVERFSLFFGPMWLKRRIGETDYGIGVIPLGGYVKITGMSPEEVFEEPSVEARAYVNQPVWKRLVVIAAGPLVNLVVAFFIFSGVYLHEGEVIVEPGAVVSGIDGHSAASGVLRPGDKLVTIDGQAVTGTSLQHAVDAAHCAGDARTAGCVASPAVTLGILRHGHHLTETVSPRYSTQYGRNLIGITYTPATRNAPTSIGTAVHYGAKQLWAEVSGTVSRLAHIYQAKDRRQFHSIAGATTLAEQATSQSTAEGLFVLGAISLALAVINLLPILPLDGGHMFWAIVEKIRRRRVSLATMERASWVGIALVLCLFGIGLSNDISTFVHGGNFLGGG